MRRLRKKQQVDDTIPPVERLFEVDAPPSVEQVLEELESPPKKVRTSRSELEERIFELEIAIIARDNYASKQREAIKLQQEKIDRYERFLHDIEVNYMLIKDYRKVQDLIDRACQWSQAHRNHHGDLGPIDRAAALEMATRRLGE